MKIHNEDLQAIAQTLAPVIQDCRKRFPKNDLYNVMLKEALEMSAARVVKVAQLATLMEEVANILSPKRS